MKKLFFCISFICVAGLVSASLAAESESTESPVSLKGGGDIRIREVYLDDIPIIADPPGVTRGGQNHFFRFRTRLWGQADVGEKMSVRARVVNENRHYETPDNTSWNAMDELVVDTLYLDLHNLCNDTIDLRIGRQDLIYGTGKVMLDGTPKDGSRTIYMDAVKLVYKGIDKTTVDLLGIYNEPENELVLHRENRDITGFSPAYDDVTESGGGIYVKNKSMDSLPCELYYFYKEESDWDQMRGTNLVEHDQLDLNTIGIRLMPQWTERLSANIEVAFQVGECGDQDVKGQMVDAAAKYHMPILEGMMPTISAGAYYLSGDDPDTADDEGWNPLWARWPQYSDLYVYAFDADGAGRWSNVMMPHVDLSFAPTGWLKTKAMVAFLQAPEENGPGGGDERGWLVSLRNDFKLGESLLMKGDKLNGHLLLEILEPGDYYNVEDTACFARCEISYAF